MNAEAKLVQLFKEAASDLSQRSSGELAQELMNRLNRNVVIRITPKGVRVTHSQYIDRLKKASEIDEALAEDHMA